MSDESTVPQETKKKFLNYENLCVAVLCFVGLIIMNPLVLMNKHSHEGMHRSSCAYNLRQMGEIFDFYADEHDGVYPPLSDDPGEMMIAAESIIFESRMDITEFVNDLALLVCPSTDYLYDSEGQDNYIDDRSYFYLGHVVMDEAEGLGYVEAYRRTVEAGAGFEQDFNLLDGGVLPRIRLGGLLERASVESARTPVMIERPGHHEPTGGNVLYLDGHVEYIQMDEKFPMTTAFIEALESIDE